MRKFAVMTMLILGCATVSMAGGGVRVPEIDGATGLAAITLVGSAVLIIRAGRKK